MKHAVFFSLLLTAGCSDEATLPGEAGTAAGGAGSPAVVSTGGATSAGGPSSGGSQVSGSGGDAGAAVGAGGSLMAVAGGESALAGSGGGGGAATGGGGGGGGAAMTFACSQLMGPNVAGEWFAAGFEDSVGSATWQVKAPHHSFVEDWANPNHDVWRDSDCQGTYTDCEIKSRCDNALPDRVLFVTQQGDYLGTPQATWESLIESALSTFKAKYPGLKRVELLTFVRAPSGQECGAETTISPLLDAAQAAVAAKSDGFVTVGPHLTASSCSAFSGPPHLTAQGNLEIAQQLAEAYKLP